jgi:hypothetical protein
VSLEPRTVPLNENFDANSDSLTSGSRKCLGQHFAEQSLFLCKLQLPSS